MTWLYANAEHIEAEEVAWCANREHGNEVWIHLCVVS